MTVSIHSAIRNVLRFYHHDDKHFTHPCTCPEPCHGSRIGSLYVTLTKVSSSFFCYHSTSVTRYLIFYVRPVLWRKIHVTPMCLYGSTFAPQDTTKVNRCICIFHEKRQLWKALCQFWVGFFMENWTLDNLYRTLYQFSQMPPIFDKRFHIAPNVRYLQFSSQLWAYFMSFLFDIYPRNLWLRLRYECLLKLVSSRMKRKLSIQWFINYNQNQSLGRRRCVPDNWHFFITA